MSAAQKSLDDFDGPDLAVLSERQREVYEAVEIGPYGPREFARRKGWSPGTVSNHLRRARKKLATGGQDGD